LGLREQSTSKRRCRIETIYPFYAEKQVLKALFSSHPYEEVAYDLYMLDNEFKMVGAGMVGELEHETGEEDFLDRVKKALKAKCIRHSQLPGRKIRRVAVCGGSGSFLIKNALNAGADVFITGDVKYHDFFEGNNQMVIVDAGHYETEQFAKELIYHLLNQKFHNFAVLVSETKTNPVNYF
jgi:putative NIF3 family GTP cyclohydrolase 1 type 2